MVNVTTKKVYDKNPDRYFQVSKMSPTTAKPSTMVNGEIYWGVGRFLGAVLRGDKTLKVWNIKTKIDKLY